MKLIVYIVDGKICFISEYQKKQLILSGTSFYDANGARGPWMIKTWVPDHRSSKYLLIEVQK